METVNVSVDTLKRLIHDLEDAVSVCQNVDSSRSPDYDKNYEKTYPFATGYSRSAMTSAIIDLHKLIAK